MGCVGKGVSYEYIYFAYNGTIDINEYRTDENKIVTQHELISHMVKHNKTITFYDHNEFKSLIYERTTSDKEGYPAYSIFKLAHNPHQSVFQRILIRMFHLSKLSAEDVKEDILNIFERYMSDKSVDFKKEWERSFDQIYADRKQYKAALDNGGLIKKLAEVHRELLVLRGKILAIRPRINDSLIEWNEYFTNKMGLHEGQRKRLTDENNSIISNIQELTNQKSSMNASLQKQKDKNNRQGVLTKQFELGRI